MTWKTLILAFAALSLSITAAEAGKRHKHWRARAHVWTQSSFEPARMIEIRPGLIISSYGCVTDEGYGRYMPCGAGARGR